MLFAPFTLLTEGHTGVALFMALSGYLFAKLLDGKQIKYSAFFWNRFIRLAPLLVAVTGLVGLRRWNDGHELGPWIIDMFSGVVMPTLPNGGWSITVEFHFYLLLPVLLFLARKSISSLFGVIVLAMLFRLGLHAYLGQVQTPAYWTIIGRIDQFVLGILAFHLRHLFVNRHLLAAAIAATFIAIYFYFDYHGGFLHSPDYPSPYRTWIWLPTVEGVAYGSIIAWYDLSFKHSTGRVSRFIAAIGAYSYSIYLLHPFVVFRMAKGIDRHLVDLSDIYVTLAIAPIAFLFMVPLGFFGFHLIEKPFLRFRVKYLKDVYEATHAQSEPSKSDAANSDTEG